MVKWVSALLLLATTSNGAVNCDTISIDPAVVVTCTIRTPEGRPFKIYTQKDGEFDGEYLSYFPSGQLHSQLKYAAGCLVDSGYIFYQSGKVRTRSSHFGCDRRSSSVSWFQNGDTSQIVTPEQTTNYHENGTLSSIVNYSGRMNKHGLSQSWRKDGSRKDSTVYRDGEITETREYFASGKIRYWAVYEDGLIKNADFYTPQGELSGKIRNGTGTYIIYSGDGNTRYLDEFKDGKEVNSRRLEPGENPSLK